MFAQKCISMAFCAVAALTGVNTVSATNAYPSKPVHLIVPFPAGSATDTVARILAAPLSTALGQQVVVENKPGADGAIAAAQVARSPADGYTLLMATNSPLAQTPLLRKTSPYDPIADFSPISFIGYNTFYLVIHPDIPAKTLTELLDYARANPNKLTYATGNTTGILSATQLVASAKVEMLQVPYKGEPNAMTDLLSGRVHLMFGTSTTVLPYIQNNKLRAIATSNMQRTHQLPQVPTMAEAGMPDFFIGSWAAVFGPANMPKDVVMRINDEINTVLQRPDIQEQFKSQAFAYSGSTPEELGALLKDQIEVSKRAIRAAGLLPN